MTKGRGETVESVTFNSYETRVSLDVSLHDMDDEIIRIRYSYSHEGLDDVPESQISQNPPPGHVSFVTRSSLTMPLDKAVILSSAEEDGTSRFFILRAEIVK